MNIKSFLAIALAIAITGAVGTANAGADGAKLFKKKCKSCHKMDKHAVGPMLKGVVGRQAGTTDFKKYKALKGSDIMWTDENLDGWLKNPKKFIGKRTTMSAKIKKEKDRAAIIEYLKSN